MKYGLLGEKLKHSFSPQIHKAFGIEDYILKEVPRDEMDAFMKAKDFTAMNVTIPYKEAVIPYCVQDEVSKAIGSVNTVVNREGTLYAYNTDCLGFLYMATEAGITFTGKRVVVLGSGGTAKTAVYVARQEGASEIVVVSRSGANISEVFGDVKAADYTQTEAYQDG
jgi:shikimate dehydrogenase